MRAKGTRQDRETIISFNEGEDIGSIWTFSQVTYRRLKKLGYNPILDNEKSAKFLIPKSEIRLPRPKRKLTPEQTRARLRALNLYRSFVPVAGPQAQSGRSTTTTNN
jgi:hypothetical protein